jgi:ABC-2 type transport system permease protein
VIPALIFSIQGEPTRIVLIDRSNKIAPRLKENLSAEMMREKAKKAAKDSLTKISASQEEKMKKNAEQFEQSIVFVDYNAEGKLPEQIRNDLGEKIRNKEIDAYLMIPEQFSDADAKYEFYSRKSSDFILNSVLEGALNDAVRSQKLIDSNISEAKLKELSNKVNFLTNKIDETGEVKESDFGFGAGLVIALLIYVTLAIYGQLIMSAVVEEKETRIAEILFSSAKPFELMMGKLVGVGLAGLTQLGIWIISAVIFLGVGMTWVKASGIDISVPNITPLMIISFFIFFILGFFIYASIFALIGSMVTTVQEGGQFAFLPIILMLCGFYFSFAIIRDPNSTLSFWASILPFVAPMTMPVRIVTEMPPFWHIALSILLNALTICGLVWLAARVYRVGMLMYGKRATIPEVWKWIRQS